MSTDDTLYREVDEEVSQDQFLNDLKKSAPMLLTGIAIIMAIVGGRTWYAGMVESRNEVAAEAYFAAERLIAEDPTGAAVAFEKISFGEQKGYAALASFRAAQIYANQGSMDQALEAYQRVAQNDKMPPRIRHLAQIRAGHLALDKDTATAAAQVSGLAEADSIMGVFAREVLGLAALVDKDYAKAEAIFDAMVADPTASDVLKERAREFGTIANMGVNGIELFPQGEANLGLQELFGNAPEGIPAGLEELIEGDVTLAPDTTPAEPAVAADPTEN